MANVGGLRPTQSNRPEVRQKRGRTATSRETSSRARLNPIAAPVDTYVQPSAAPKDNDLLRLSQALSQLNPAIGQIASQYMKGKEEDQMAKLRFYTEQFMQDKETGAVRASQVKEMFPELVPTVASRIAQATGEIEARRWVQGEIQSVLEDDALRLNTDNRLAYLEQVRERAREMIGDNEFYGTGFLSQLDRSLNEFETAWMRETASHHEAVQAEAFSNQVAETLRSGGDLVALDRQWKQSSSLNNLERNKLVVDSVVAEAVATNNPALLERVPDRFLNAESKAQLARTKQQIETAMYSQFVRARELSEYERQQSIRSGKVEILRRLTEGEGVNPAEFYKMPELYEYALRLNSQPTLDGTQSVRNAAAFRSNLLRAGTTGNFMDAFAGDSQFFGDFREEEAVSQETLRDHILSRPDLNPSEKQQLLDEIPLLMEGVNLLRDADTTAYFQSSVDDDLKVFAQSPQGQVLQVMGVNAQGDVRSRFYETLRQEVNAYVEDKGEMPRGQNKLELLRRAEQAARQRLEYLQRNYRDVAREQRNGASTTAPTPQNTVDGGEPTVIKRWNPETGRLEIVNE